MFRMLIILLTCFISNATVVTRFDQEPPPRTDLAATARYVINNANWGVIGSISTIKQIAGRPFTNVISISDGPIGTGTGIPYMYVTDLDQTMEDVKNNSHVTLSVSEIIFGYCQNQTWDAEDPRCARLTLTGTLMKTSGEETAYAQKYLFAQHPEMKSWSVVHDFYVVKLNIDMVWIIDFFGGATIVDLKEYFAAK